MRDDDTDKQVRHIMGFLGLTMDEARAFVEKIPDIERLLHQKLEAEKPKPLATKVTVISSLVGLAMVVGAAAGWAGDMYLNRNYQTVAAADASHKAMIEEITNGVGIIIYEKELAEVRQKIRALEEKPSMTRSEIARYNRYVSELNRIQGIIDNMSGL
jgi:hypothetical protein